MKKAPLILIILYLYTVFLKKEIIFFGKKRYFSAFFGKNPLILPKNHLHFLIFYVLMKKILKGALFMENILQPESAFNESITNKQSYSFLYSLFSLSLLLPFMPLSNIIHLWYRLLCLFITEKTWLHAPLNPFCHKHLPILNSLLLTTAPPIIRLKF